MSARFTAAEKHREIIREIEMRKSVYPRRITSGSMSKQQAERQIAVELLLQIELERQGEKKAP